MRLQWRIGQILRGQKTVPGVFALSITIGVIIVLVLVCDPEGWKL
jgi:hypothetical protein